MTKSLVFRLVRLQGNHYKLDKLLKACFHHKGNSVYDQRKLRTLMETKKELGLLKFFQRIGKKVAANESKR